MRLIAAVDGENFYNSGLTGENFNLAIFTGSINLNYAVLTSTRKIKITLTLFLNKSPNIRLANKSTYTVPYNGYFSNSLIYENFENFGPFSKINFRNLVTKWRTFSVSIRHSSSSPTTLLYMYLYTSNYGLHRKFSIVKVAITPRKSAAASGFQLSMASCLHNNIADSCTQLLKKNPSPPIFVNIFSKYLVSVCFRKLMYSKNTRYTVFAKLRLDARDGAIKTAIVNFRPVID